MNSSIFVQFDEGQLLTQFMSPSYRNQWMITLENCGTKEKLFVVRWEDHSVVTKISENNSRGILPLRYVIKFL